MCQATEYFTDTKSFQIRHFQRNNPYLEHIRPTVPWQTLSEASPFGSDRFEIGAICIAVLCNTGGVLL